MVLEDGMSAIVVAEAAGHEPQTHLVTLGRQGGGQIEIKLVREHPSPPACQDQRFDIILLDDNSVPISGATVAIRSNDQERAPLQKTDANGTVRLCLSSADEAYSVSAEAPGFRGHIRTVSPADVAGGSITITLNTEDPSHDALISGLILVDGERPSAPVIVRYGVRDFFFTRYEAFSETLPFPMHATLTNDAGYYRFIVPYEEDGVLPRHRRYVSTGGSDLSGKVFLEDRTTLRHALGPQERMDLNATSLEAARQRAHENNIESMTGTVFRQDISPEAREDLLANPNAHMGLFVDAVRSIIDALSDRPNSLRELFVWPLKFTLYDTHEWGGGQAAFDTFRKACGIVYYRTQEPSRSLIMHEFGHCIRQALVNFPNEVIPRPPREIHGMDLAAFAGIDDILFSMPTELRELPRDNRNDEMLCGAVSCYAQTGAPGEDFAETVAYFIYDAGYFRSKIMGRTRADWKRDPRAASALLPWELLEDADIHLEGDSIRFEGLPQGWGERISFDLRACRNADAIDGRLLAKYLLMQNYIFGRSYDENWDEGSATSLGVGGRMCESE